jgi:hypothetical protein
MRNYCVGRLRMSMDQAGKRIQVARAALRIPEIFECLADGRLSVTTAATVTPHLTLENSAALLASVAFKSKDEIVLMLASRARAVAAPVAPGLVANVQESSGSHALAVESHHVVDTRGRSRLMGGRPWRLPCGRRWL